MKNSLSLSNQAPDMKRPLKTLLLLTISVLSISHSQAQVKFYKSYEQAQKEAIARQLPIFISLDYSSVRGAPALINIYAPEKEVADYYQAHFIPYRVEHRSPEGLKLQEKYKLSVFPNFLFLKPDGSLILKSNIVPRDFNFFMTLAKEAEQRYTTKTGVSDYDERYKANQNIDRQFLKEYITLRIQSGILTNDKLIDQYVDFLTVGELNSYAEVLFIHQAGPLVFGRAYNLATANRSLVDSVFKTASLQERIDMNNRIINNTLAEAIARKDRNMAFALATFVRNTWNPNYKEGQKNALQKLLTFYKATNDTAAYFSQAAYHYDYHFMSISVDSIRLAMAKNRNSLDSLKSAVRQMKREGKGNRAFSQTSIGSSSATHVLNVAHMLNNAAWDLYSMGCHQQFYLKKAVLWSKRAIEIDSNATYYDTLAHLSYRLGLYDEALLNQKKAITLAVQQKILSKEQINGFREQAFKMQNRTL